MTLERETPSQNNIIRVNIMPITMDYGKTMDLRTFLLLPSSWIHRHHLLPLDRELWMIHQEDRQSRKIKMRHERNLGQSFHSGHSENMFSAKVATSWQPMNFVISLCAGIHNCNFDVIVVFFETWPGLTKTETDALFWIPAWSA